VLLSLAIATPVGVLAGIYLNEYARESWLTRVVNLAVVNLAGVPTLTRRASISALRLNAASILSRTSMVLTRGLTMMLFVTPFTPVRSRTVRAAASFWYCQSSVPFRASQPLLTVTES